MASIPEAIQSIVSPTDTKQVILDRLGEREMYWRQQTEALAEANKKMLHSLTQKDKLLKELSDEVQLYRINTSTIQARNNQDQPSAFSPQHIETQPVTSSSMRHLKRAPPVFSGTVEEDIKLWIARLNNFLQYEVLNDRELIQIAVTFLEGAAFQWWTDTMHDIQMSGTELTWDLFVEKCVKRWGGINIKEQTRVQLDQLRQVKSVAEYNNEFEKLIGRLDDDYANESLKIHQYIRGLKQHLRLHAAGKDFQTAQECMAAMTAYESVLNMEQRRFQSLTQRATQQRMATPRRPFTPKAFRKGKTAFTPTAKRLFVIQNSPKSSGQGLSNVWADAVQVYGFGKAKEMYENEQCFKCGRKGHRANICRSQQVTPELSGNLGFEVENEGQVEVESEKEQGRDE